MIMAWMLKSWFGLPRWIFVLLGVALILAGLMIYIKRAENLDDQMNQEIGAALEREEALEETVKRVETANETREEINRPGAAGDQLRYDQCLRSARTPANCKRFLPERPAD